MLSMGDPLVFLVWYKTIHCKLAMHSSMCLDQHTYTCWLQRAMEADASAAVRLLLRRYRLGLSLTSLAQWHGAMEASGQSGDIKVLCVCVMLYCTACVIGCMKTLGQRDHRQCTLCGERCPKTVCQTRRWACSWSACCTTADLTLPWATSWNGKPTVACTYIAQYMDLATQRLQQMYCCVAALFL